MNKVFLCGNLGEDPKSSQAGASTVVNVSLATKYFTKDQREPDVDWHRLVFWNRQAEVVSQYATKGAKLLIEGRLKTRKWTDNNGANRSTTEVVVVSFEFCEKRENKYAGPNDSHQRGREPQSGKVGPTSNPYADDDIAY
jgi:single-strand DNA-binding protein